jgi:hypothetical protein
MPITTLPAFRADEYKKAHLFLATQVAEMMGRKFEENDWAKVYCAAKGITLGSWSNLNIDITYGNLGVEHKMIGRKKNRPIMDACGTCIMHPAGTRSIRIPAEEDPTMAARNVLQQYVEIVEFRTALVRTVNEYHHDRRTKAETVMALQALGMSPTSAKAALPVEKRPIGSADDPPDMRIGWLLWQGGLREFLYFEEAMTKPNPQEYFAEWHESGGGRRKKSRNLWVYSAQTKAKVYSITTEAGAKIQPYFTVPPPNDPNLYHFIVQGEACANGLVRVWLTQVTADLLRDAVGTLTPETIDAAVAQAKLEQKRQEKGYANPFGVLAVEVLVSTATYERLQEVFSGVSDEHNFKQLLDVLSALR